METQGIQIIQLIANVLVAPIFWLLWNIQGRLSKIEGQIQRSKDKE